jgi:hypothetical protein
MNMMARSKELSLNTGKIGEDAIAEFFGFKKTNNWYDPEKDGSAECTGVDYEVKTFRLNFKTQGFWIDQSQYNKVDNVDALFFVRIPESESELAQVYLATNHKDPKSYRIASRRDGTKVRCYQLTKCLPLFKIDAERSRILYENSVKNSIHGRFK